MPRIKSAKKRMRQTVTRTAANKTKRSQLRTALKKVRATPIGEARDKAFAEAVQLIDRAGHKRLIHPNTAARQKSRLAKAGRAK